MLNSNYSKESRDQLRFVLKYLPELEHLFCFPYTEEGFKVNVLSLLHWDSLRNKKNSVKESYSLCV